MKNWDKFYRDGGDTDNEKNFTWHKKFLEQKVFTGRYESEDTLLDAGCGDGFWSFELAKRFAKVTGVDPSAGGIEMANKRKNRDKIKNIEFIQCCALEVEEKVGKKFDIVFCRGAVHLNLPSSDHRFIENFKKMVALCRKEVIFLVATGKPYERWRKSVICDDTEDTEWYSSQWYMHDPELVGERLKDLGEVYVSQSGPLFAVRLVLSRI